jgi:hypothetical protein
LTAPDGQTFDGPISEDGTYSIIGPPFEGEVTAFLVPMQMPRPYKDKDSSKAPKVPIGMTQVPVSKKYLDPRTSGIKLTIEKDKKVEKDITVD